MRDLPGKSLRGRLTILYGLLLTLALVLYAGGTSAYFLHNLRHQLDVSLDRDIETVEGLLSLEPDGHLEKGSEEGEAREGDLGRGYLLEVWSGKGVLLYRSAELNGAAMGQPVQLNGNRWHEAPRTVRLANGTRVRVASRVHRIEGQPLVLRLGVSEEPLWQQFWEMVGVMSVGLPITVLLIGLTGYMVAGRALRPVDLMARHAAKISAERLDDRLTISNPDDELGHLGQAFNRTLGRLEESFDQLRRFTADASHELRTPLTAIRSVGEVALQKAGGVPYYRDIIGSMLEEVNRLTRLVESLLTISRADAGQIELHQTTVNALELVQEAATLLESLAEEKQQTVVVEGNPNLNVWADRLILRQAVINLLDNAVKYSPVGGKIHVDVSVDTHTVLIAFQDSGPGIPIEHRDKVFERFYRIDKARTRAEGGTGLGLSIVKWAVSVNGGRIDFDSEPGHGCTFTMRLPLSKIQDTTERLS
jgi:heavy metal sensor kinase